MKKNNNDSKYNVGNNSNQKKKKWSTIFKEMKEKYFKCTILYSANIFF